MGDYLRRKIAAQTRRPIVPGMARERLRILQAGQKGEYTEPLIDFIPRVTPQYVRPEPLAPYINVVERCPTERVFAVVAAPPQHGKTDCTMHAFAWLVQKMPGKQHVYATYSQTRSRSVSDKCGRIFDRAGIRYTGTKDQWYFPDCGSSIIWTSVGGRLTGEGISGVLFIDDPYKDRREACSPVIQAHRMDWYDDVAETRLNPGSSIIVFMARWDTNDLSGQLLTRKTPLGEPYEHVNLKAIADEIRPLGDDREPGEALWEARKPLSELVQKRATNAYSFASLYQGDPRPRGGTLFKEPAYYDELPTRGYRVGLGADLAYSKKTHADFSCVVEVWEHNGLFYVVDAHRAQVEAPQFVLTLRHKTTQHPGTPINWYAAGVERGAADFVIEKGVPLIVHNPPGDKFSRALPTSELWNGSPGEGVPPRLMLPSSDYADANGMIWLDSFAYEVTNFTGINDAHDDQVDALVSACDAVNFAPDTTLLRGPSSRR